MPGETILVVEDNEKSRRLLRKVLEVSGYRVVEAETGLGAVRAAIEHRPDLILMDYQLPDIDGVEAFHRIRAEPALARVPVIAVTASAMPQDGQRMRDAGFDGLATKPISVNGLLATVAQFVAPKAVS